MKKIDPKELKKQSKELPKEGKKMDYQDKNIAFPKPTPKKKKGRK